VAGHRVNIVKFLPPLVITEREVDSTLQALDAVLEEAHKFPGGLWAMGMELVKNAFKR
jgi:acetylornithine/succinyldiaminopimelate/putrescine aminotransferase